MNKLLHVIKVSEAQLKLESLFDSKQSFFAYFHGAYDESTGRSWCSDCDISRPLVEKQISKLENQKKINVLFCKFPIETSLEYKNPEFIYRTNKFKIKKIPTLIFYRKGVELGRMVEDELFNEDNLSEFFDDCLEQEL